MTLRTKRRGCIQLTTSISLAWSECHLRFAATIVVTNGPRSTVPASPRPSFWRALCSQEGPERDQLGPEITAYVRLITRRSAVRIRPPATNADFRNPALRPGFCSSQPELRSPAEHFAGIACL